MDQFKDIGLCSTMIEGMTTDVAASANPIFSSAGRN